MNASGQAMMSLCWLSVPSIHECIWTSDDVSMLALRAGYLTEQQDYDIVEHGTPRRLLPTLAVTLDRKQLNDDKLYRLRHNKHHCSGVTY